MKNFVIPAAAASAMALMLSAPAFGHNAQGGAKLTTTLSGAAETPVGDPDGTGSFSATVNPGQMQVCYQLTVVNVATPTAAHIHEAVAGQSGPVVVTLTAPATGSSAGCATVTRELALELIKSPAEYYVNVHNAVFPGGAVRGQLSK